MPPYEYKVCPAPTKGQKSPGVKGVEARFAHTVEAFLNAQAAEGWEYIRSDILPSEERQGLTSSQTIYRTLLVFRRAAGAANSPAQEVIAEAQTRAEAAPEPGAPGTRAAAPDAAASLRWADAPQTKEPEAPQPPAPPKQT